MSGLDGVMVFLAALAAVGAAYEAGRARVYAEWSRTIAQQILDDINRTAASAPQVEPCDQCGTTVGTGWSPYTGTGLDNLCEPCRTAASAPRSTDA